MQIATSLPSVSRVSIGNREQVSRADRYRSEFKITEQDRQDHIAIDWDATQSPSSLLAKDGDRYTVSNFRWGFEEKGLPKDWAPKFGDTTIDTSKVKNVYLALEPFAPELVAAHGLLVFEMEDDAAVKGADGREDFGFALSVEARRPEGESYGLTKGLKRSFGMIYQLGSLSDQLQKVSRQRGHKLVLHPLQLDAEQKKELVQQGLEAATQDRVGEWYHTLTNSCFTAGVDLINSVVPESNKMARWSRHLKVARPATFMPAFVGPTVKRRGLMADAPTLELQPDRQLFPGKQAKETGLRQQVGALSQSALWQPAFLLAGSAVGGAAGYALGGALASTLGGAAPVAGAALGALGGAWAGSNTADLIAVKTDVEVRDAQQWYTAESRLPVEEAERRLRSEF